MIKNKLTNMNFTISVTISVKYIDFGNSFGERSWFDARNNLGFGYSYTCFSFCPPNKFEDIMKERNNEMCVATS